MAIGCGDHDNAVTHEAFQQPPQNHRVCDVRTLKLVEAEHARSGGNVSAHERDCVKVGAILHLESVKASVHFLHEVMEVDPCLGGDVRGESVVEHVHEHCLAGANLTEEVHPLRHVRGNLGSRG